MEAAWCNDAYIRHVHSCEVPTERQDVQCCCFYLTPQDHTSASWPLYCISNSTYTAEETSVSGRGGQQTGFETSTSK